MSGFGQDYRDEIRNMAGLLAEGRKEEALSGLDNLNWRKIHNISAIVQASELYEACGRVEDAKDLLLMAHEKSPIGRVVLYHLCLLCVRRGEYEEAKKYYEDYIEIAPHDFQKLVLKYNLAKARGGDEYTLIAILEELKENEFVDEWAYQLAYLYHKTGQVDKCMSLCDEIALYYGDGPYVEKSLELKMLYHPLNDEQERQYRKIRGLQEDDKIQNRTAKEYHPMKEEIPVPKSAPGKFDTVNLQAEIRKNIDEIMQATETGEVDETLMNIENLVGELPYVKMDEKNKTTDNNGEKSDNNSIMEHYQKYLDEEYDGQMSISIPDNNVSDPQIKGQMTIQDVMENWEKTKRAAEAALNDADREKLEKTKEVALEKANRIMNRLEKAMPMLDAGTNPQELIKEEILQKKPEDEPVAEEADESINTDESAGGEWKSGITFAIPKVKKTGDELGVGLEVPVIDGKGNPEIEIKDNKPAKKEMKSWEPPHLDKPELTEDSADKVSYRDATKIMEGVNNMLQQEIERFIDKKVEENSDSPDDSQAKNPIEENSAPKIDYTEDVTNPEESLQHSDEKIEERPINEDEMEDEEHLSDENSIKEEPNLGVLDEDASGLHMNENDLEQLDLNDDEETEEEIPTDNQDDESILAETLVTQNMAKKQFKQEIKEAEANKEKGKIDLDKTVVLEQLGEEVRAMISDNDNGEDVQNEAKDTSDDDQEQDAFGDQKITKLTNEEKELFSYFLPVPDMENKICSVLTNVKARLNKEEGPLYGNIAIAGGHGSGKTTMAKAIIMTIQNEIDKPGNNIGRIDAEKLNDKNFQGIYDKIKGGCLVIEQAGDLNKETAISLSLMMNNDSEGTLLILEDTKAGINRALSLDGNFGGKFSERIDIPVFTVDELVNFGLKYAKDEGYTVDEMGKLAMYDRITKEQRGDRPMYLRDVIEIMDEAIEKASSKGFFHRRKVDDDGNPILVEKDFF